jgi:hypothetical protein
MALVMKAMVVSRAQRTAVAEHQLRLTMNRTRHETDRDQRTCEER